MDVLARVAPFFLLIAAGAVAARMGRIKLADTEALAAYVFWIAFPALLIHSLSHAPLPDGRLAQSMAIYAAATLLPLPLILVIGRWAGWDRQVRAGASFAAVSNNTAFLGAPLAVALFGARAAAPASALVAVDCTLILALGSGVLAGAAHDRGWRTAALAVTRHPLVLSALAGLALAYARWLPPAPLDQALALLGATASPVGLVALGAVVGLQAGGSSREVAAPVATALIFKLMVNPALVWLAMGWIGADPFFRAIATLLAACPVAVGVFIQTRALNVFSRGGALAVVVSTIVAVASLTLLGATLR